MSERLAIDVTGRHLAAASHEGITLWDLPTGAALATLPVTTAVSNVQFDPTGALLTAHPLTLRWPISSSPDGHTIGPPQFLQWYQTWDGFSCSRDGRSIALAIYHGGGMVFDAENPDRRRFLPQRDTRAIALSPDGRWAVTSSHDYSSVKVWDARTGRLVHDFPESPRRGVGTFSPDGHWLSVGHAGRRLGAVRDRDLDVQDGLRAMLPAPGYSRPIPRPSPTRPITRLRGGLFRWSMWRRAASWPD